MSEAEYRDRSAGLDPQSLAERVGEGMFAADNASHCLGMVMEEIGPGYARLSMTVRENMLNGLRMCHGGFITTLADSAFAYSCNSYNEQTVAQGIAVEFLAPARPGDVLTAEGREVALAGRTGLYDISVVNQKGELIAVLRGKSYRLKGRAVVEL
ncbi:MAG TPA: hydroxyphenylacetyl-CoA thioesterase PaaI [Rhodocyclaceae bacterium]|nr:hydroxyphenylacetyl-CoA thioesterase PaaI [Rhodocyclaceae bacterium]HRQ46315.1 hydroxyphenylacetyl-CoA thioesterase PaaI [Rhodocyclaceae bacterium]